MLPWFEVVLVVQISSTAWTGEADRVSVLQGEEVMLPCILPPNLIENNTVYWYNQNVLMSSGENITIDEDETERFSIRRPYKSDWYLRIFPTLLEDQGFYQCTDGDTFVSMVQLFVESPPVVIGYGADRIYIQACESARVVMYCNVTGRPRPVIRWYYKKTEDNELEYLQLNGEKIFIPEAVANSSGIYFCKVQNIHGQTEMQFHVNVIVKLSGLEPYNQVMVLNPKREDGDTQFTGPVPLSSANIKASFVNAYLLFAYFITLFIVALD